MRTYSERVRILVRNAVLCAVLLSYLESTSGTTYVRRGNFYNEAEDKTTCF